MARRNALRSLSRKFPAPAEVKQILDALHGEGDVTAAVVGSSLLESALEKYLIAAMSEKTAQSIAQIFENRGPLSDFNGKILVGTAFGVISPQMAEHFQTIRRIRNAFAHARLPIHFEMPEVRREIEAFGMLQAMQTALKGRRETEQVPVPNLHDNPAKSSYLLIVAILLIILDDLYAIRGQGRLYDDRATSSAPV